MTAPLRRTADLDRPRTVPPRATGRPVVAVDLDQTLIYSVRAVAGAHSAASAAAPVCVEFLDGAPASLMTQRAAGLVSLLAQEAVLVPVTTRTRAQYARVRLPGRAPAYAVTSNGGQLLVDGVADPAWAARVARALAGAGPLAEVRAHVGDLLPLDISAGVRVADELFCYAVVRRDALPAELVAELGAWAATRGWVVSLQGRKLYCVPACLRKSAAVAEVVHRVEAPAVFAAGDSLLDAELLTFADAAIRPAHGELAERNWTHASVAVTTERGMAGGEELCAWLLGRVRGTRRSG